jgi:FkbM family methyltransferase
MQKLLEKSPACFAKRLAIKHHDSISWLIPDRYFVFSAPGGKIHLNIKESSMMLARALGLYEPEKTRAVQTLLNLGETFVDVGGNKGDFALLAAKITGENGKVVCIEPEPTNLSWIRRSIDLNGYKNIQLCNLALSDHDGESLLHLGTKSGFHTLMSGAPDRDRGSLKVIVRKLDSLLPELHVGTVNALKIDVEGAELQVLKGAAETIAANPQIVLFLDIHPFLGVNPSEVFDYLGFLGLTVCEMRQPYNLPATPHEGIFDIVARRLGALDNRQLSKSDYTH